VAEKIQYVGVIVPSGWREMVEGVVRFAHPNHQWRVKWFSGWGGSNLLTDVFAEQFDGIIVSEDRPGLAASIAAGPWPTVLASDGYGNPTLPCVDVDNVAVGQLAADYLMSRGFENLVVCGTPHLMFSRVRCKAFVDAVTKAGHTCRPCYAAEFESQVAQKVLGDFLIQQPKPLAVFCENDWCAKHVADVCHSRSLRVPEDVAILGVDNDELLCQLTYPPLSSVVYPIREIGYNAARLLDELMNHHPAPSGPLLIAPHGITTRASTDILAMKDADVAEALRFIRENAHLPITVSSILTKVPIGRRTLEKKFRHLLNRSPLDEIKRIRLDAAKLHLSNSELRIPEIAHKCGFPDARRFATVFKQTFGCVPTEYRLRSRLPQSNG